MTSLASITTMTVIRPPTAACCADGCLALVIVVPDKRGGLTAVERALTPDALRIRPVVIRRFVLLPRRSEGLNSIAA